MAGDIASEFYLWDNWRSVSNIGGDGAPRVHRFSLAAPRTLPADARHAAARIVHFVGTEDRGWRLLGEPIAPGPRGSFDAQALWSGCAAEIDGRLALLYTGVAEGAGWPQSIGIAWSTDGRHFEKYPVPILAPTSALGYDTGRTGGVTMAWRDPHLCRALPDDGAWHLLFAAKQVGHGSCIGHAVARAEDLSSWELRPPLKTPGQFCQMEAPSILHAHGQLYLLVGTTDREVLSGDERANGQAVRCYAAPALDAPFEPAASDGTDLLLPQGAPLYAAQFVPPGGAPFAAGAASPQAAIAGFYSASHPQPFSWSADIPLTWSGKRLAVLPRNGA